MNPNARAFVFNAGASTWTPPAQSTPPPVPVPVSTTVLAPPAPVSPQIEVQSVEVNSDDRGNNAEGICIVSNALVLLVYKLL